MVGAWPGQACANHLCRDDFTARNQKMKVTSGEITREYLDEFNYIKADEDGGFGYGTRVNAALFRWQTIANAMAEEIAKLRNLGNYQGDCESKS